MPGMMISLLGVGSDGTVTIQITPVQQPVVPPPAAPPAPPAPPKVIGVGVVDVFTVLNVRDGPGTEHRILGTLRPGEMVQIIGHAKGWFEILWHGRRAWVCGYYVWTPGERVRNPDLRGRIGRKFGEKALPPAPPPPDPAPAGGSGARRPDGGLAIPVYNQNAIGARVPSGFCGPTSLKMVLEYYGIKKDINFLGDKDVGGATPVYIPGVGAGHQAMLDMLRYCGLKGSTMTHGQSIAWLRQQTASGSPVVVSVKGNYGAGWTTAGHILVVAGVTPDGRVILNDSAGGKRITVSGSMFFNAWNASNRMAIVARP